MVNADNARDDVRAEVLARVAGALAGAGVPDPVHVTAVVMRSVVDGLLGELAQERATVKRAVALREETRGERDALRAELEEARADAERSARERDDALSGMRLARNEAAGLLARLKQAEAERDAARAAWLVVGEPVLLPGDGYAPRHARRDEVAG